ncbi:helix-turn-helix domain-containing protein [Paraburkholderia bengalensis]|uniref:Helix-turn-helix domain-containing protein n=1 Tax=Paraburkholderia bengalensis TaxID=2747562 RepID=A0ABU8IRK8_9BURK
MRAIDRAIKIAGSRSRLARAIGVAPQMVSQWAREVNPKPISIPSCARIEKATGVPCEQLNPNEDWVTLRAVLCAPARDLAESIDANDDVQPPVGGTNKSSKMARHGLREAA